MRHLNLGGSDGVWNFANGFPIAGSLSRKYLLPRGGKMGVLLPEGEISDSAPARIRGRTAKSGRRNPPLLWIEAMEQVEEGGGPRYSVI